MYNTPTECLSAYQSYDKNPTDALSIFAGVAELADAPDLGSGGLPCRFKSCHPHQKEIIILIRKISVLWFFYCQNGSALPFFIDFIAKM